MRYFKLALGATALIACAVHAQIAANSNSQLSWPATTNTTRPWTRWWWLGCAVDKENLSRLLAEYNRAGLGGVEITCIYGIKGQEQRHIPYLSPQWTEMLKHTCAEAKRLGMGVDLPPGSGWCIGGPVVPRELADATLELTAKSVTGGQALKTKLSAIRVQAAVAFSDSGERIHLTDKVNAAGELEWTPPAGTWTIYTAAQRFSGRMVKRPAPGGEGYSFNPYTKKSLDVALQPFDELFAQLPKGAIRAQFHDSFEYAGNWCDDVFDGFKTRRGYDLRDHLPALMGKGSADEVMRVKADYRATMNELLLDNFIARWVAWCHSHGQLARNQAHGSPGNLLDLYAAADIPETEMFNRDRDPLIAKFASSAAHVMGKPLASSETCTWMAEHFTETLADAKKLVDEMFVSGINHVVYHGTAYSPAAAAWPGWLFYASSHFEPNNPMWRDFPALNSYITRCQSVLQSGKPDNEVLLYWPFNDVTHAEARALLPQLTIHGTGWFEDQPFGNAARALWTRGYTFDYASDRQLELATVEARAIKLPGSKYRVIVVPPCRFMPVETLRKMIELAKNGATIIFQDHLPDDVPGLGNLEQRRAKFKSLAMQITPQAGESEIGFGEGRVIIGHDLEALLAKAKVAREPLVDRAGLLLIRRAHERGRHYFIANHSEQPLDDWIALTTDATSIAIMDPMTGNVGLAQIRRREGATEVCLQLQPGQSCLLRTFNQKIAGPKWSYVKTAGAPIELMGAWQVKFLAGGPALPASFETRQLGSWAARDEAEAQRFAGAARYTLPFDAPNHPAKRWLLDLGKTCESARVRVNGKDLGTLIAPPFRVVIEGLKAKGNVLEVEVTNVAANRIRDLDRRGVQWKIFHDINIVNRDYKPFDASNWPLRDSGLLGPVTMRMCE